MAPGDLVHVAARLNKLANMRHDVAHKALQGEKQRPGHTLLSPEDVSGLYEAGRGLLTTLDGEPREITAEDLKAFRGNVDRLRAQYKAKSIQKLLGITARQAIDHSRPIDRERANAQIHTAIPIRATKAGFVRFMTNAGPDSDVSRHYVDVEFLNFQPAVASGKPPAEVAKAVSKGPIKINCDCGRHRYWYDFVVSAIGASAAPHPQTHFPKIRNPHLTGICCKHLLRVLTLVDKSPTFYGYLQGVIAREQAGESKRAALTAKQAQQDFLKQLQGEHPSQRKVRAPKVKGETAPTPDSKGKVEVLKPGEVAKLTKRAGKTPPAPPVKPANGKTPGQPGARQRATAAAQAAANLLATIKAKSAVKDERKAVADGIRAIRHMRALNVINQGQFDAMMATFNAQKPKV